MEVKEERHRARCTSAVVERMLAAFNCQVVDNVQTNAERKRVESNRVTEEPFYRGVTWMGNGWRLFFLRNGGWTTKLRLGCWSGCSGRIGLVTDKRASVEDEDEASVEE
jgi:hypothetical protein